MADLDGGPGHEHWHSLGRNHHDVAEPYGSRLGGISALLKLSRAQRPPGNLDMRYLLVDAEA
ncbi:hypothetical protein [Nesterenkonia sp. Act20]|uniref:hypothetical protein n=1 Tax=Nesterenkonia sp. Act20 TaxID=1483432 RepID=UPI001C454B9A|nr:hypothetical protein [Nesterenkonia sp. Act20]